MSYSPYCVPLNPNPLRLNRKIRIVCIGAGFAGITIAYKIAHDLKLEDTIDLKIYEKQQDVGGTWLANHYPGLSCDVPIHVYTLPFNPKHDWKRFLATGPEIKEYIQETSAKFSLDKYMQFNSRVNSAVWDEASGKWQLTVGSSSTPLMPTIDGIDNFKGRRVHTGDWDDSLDWKGKRVAVIGNGSSGIQAFRAMQEDASFITHFIRKPTWISMSYAHEFTPEGKNFEYSKEQIESFKDPETLFQYRKKIESYNNGLFKRLVFNETNQDSKLGFRKALEKFMSQHLHGDANLISQLQPSYQPWCRRLTPDDKYLEAIQAPNAEFVDKRIEAITDDGIRLADGSLRHYDIIVFATGFANSRTPPWTMKGRNGILLSERWKDNVDGYISVCAPDMPNYFSIGCGPNFPIANGPVLSALGFVADYILKWAVKISSEDIKSVTVNNEAVEAYNIYLQQILKRTAWNEDCDSWYKKGRADEYRTGITAIYPGSMNHFREMLNGIRGEDFDIVYNSNNRFNFVGNGLTKVDFVEGGDLAGYLSQTMKFDAFRTEGSDKKH
ncbi:Flavin-containing monooxygenase, partial [Scytalidium lignicola]